MVGNGCLRKEMEMKYNKKNLTAGIAIICLISLCTVFFAGCISSNKFDSSKQPKEIKVYKGGVDNLELFKLPLSFDEILDGRYILTTDGVENSPNSNYFSQAVQEHIIKPDEVLFFDIYEGEDMFSLTFVVTNNSDTDCTVAKAVENVWYFLELRLGELKISDCIVVPEEKDSLAIYEQKRVLLDTLGQPSAITEHKYSSEGYNAWNINYDYDEFSLVFSFYTIAEVDSFEENEQTHCIQFRYVPKPR
jgi:hypothetical protein